MSEQQQTTTPLPIPPRSNSDRDPIQYLRDSSVGHILVNNANNIVADDDAEDDDVLAGTTAAVRPAMRGGAYRPQSFTINNTEDPPARGRPDLGSAWPYRESLSFTRMLVFYGAGAISSDENREACGMIMQARSLRERYFGGKGTEVVGDESQLRDGKLSFSMAQGVAEIHHESQPGINLITVPSIEEFSKDYEKLVEMTSAGAMRSFCFQRLQLLSTSFKMHTTMNSSVETEEQSNLLGTDFYRTMKVDNHIHAAAAPSAKQFVNFVKQKLENEADAVVHKKKETVDGVEKETDVTLSDVYEEHGLDMDHLTIDAFNVLADYSVYQRFDNFNSKYSPFRLADMRRIFLKTNNHMQGRYFAELLKVVTSRHEQNKGHNSACEVSEPQLSMPSIHRHNHSHVFITDETEYLRYGAPRVV